MELRRKLEILADAAKYDASCASSGTEKRDSRPGHGKPGGIGSTEGMGICHAYAPDGRCISLLKVLLTNACVFDCAYCVNRASSNLRRARFTVEELAAIRLRIDEAKEARRTERRAPAPRFAPAGQSTQMIVGADDSDDAAVLRAGTTLYAGYGLRRVYYSAYSPIPDASRLLPPAPPPLVREHRLYQADWLMRFYGFAAEEILAGGEGGMLD